MPISMPWTSTTMSALQFQMIFKSSSRPSYLGLRTQPQASKIPFQVRSSFRLSQTRHTTPRPREWDPTATTSTQKQHFNRPWCWEFKLVKEQRPKKKTPSSAKNHESCIFSEIQKLPAQLLILLAMRHPDLLDLRMPLAKGKGLEGHGAEDWW